MKKIQVCCLFLCLCCAATGQYRSPDSLKQLLPVNNDTLKLVYNRLISFGYEETNKDSAALYGMNYLKLSRKLGYKLNEADALTRLSYDLQGSGKGLEMTFEAQRLIQQSNNEKLLPAKYLQMLNIPDTLQSFSKYKQYVNGRLIFIWGTHYWANNEIQKGYSYFLQTLNMGQSLPDYELLMLSYLAFGIVNKNNDSSLAYLKKAYHIAKEKGLSREIGNIENVLAQKFEYRKDYLTQLSYLKASAEHNIQQGRINSAAGSYVDLATYYQKHTNREDSSLFYGTKALDLVPITGNPYLKYSVTKFFFETYRNRGNKDSAFKYLDLMLAASDEISGEDKTRQFESVEFNRQLQEAEMRASNEKFKNRVRVYGLLAGLAVFVLLATIFWRNNKRRKREYALLKHQKLHTDKALRELESTQAQLIQSEKMASLGQLTAGIAHEIQNPLNFVNNFSDVNSELVEEARQEIDKGNAEEVKILLSNIADNEQKIKHHGKRADAIVKGMLQHSRTSSGQKEPTDLNKLADEYFRLAYQGFRAKDKSFNAKVEAAFDQNVGNVNVITQDIGRVILNLINNAFYAVNEKSKQNIPGYEPTVTVFCRKANDKVELHVRDNGNGISERLRDKIFQPFFTTKPTGQGTGLGLSLAYDIVKAHGGEIRVQTKEGEGTEFTIQLPE